MNPLSVDVVVRCRNEMPFAEKTLVSLGKQRGVNLSVLFIDNGSNDGSRAIAVATGARVVDWPAQSYVPGRVLNYGMAQTTTDLVAFINADCVPRDLDAIRLLLEPFEDPSVAATFARQEARPDASRIVRADYERAFGPISPKLRHGQFFSMAASALRRSAWSSMPFDETLRYSEDVDWTCRLSYLGWNVVYTPGASFEHSHNYSLGSEFRRRRGEGAAERRIFHLGPPSLVADGLRPMVGAITRDVRSGAFGVRELSTRACQAAGWYVGRRSKCG